MMNVSFGVCPESYKLVAGSSSKSSPATVKALPKEITLVAGRNDTFAFQLLVSADEAFALNVGTSLWFSQDEDIRTVRVHAEFPFPAKISHVGMHVCDDGYFRADSILDDEVVEYDKKQVVPLWIEATVPADAPCGSMTGKVRLFESYCFDREVPLGEVTVSLTVFPYILPENRGNGFHLDLWQHLSNIARKHEVRLWSNEHFAVLEPYCRSLGELGVKCVTVVASEVPWNGQACQEEKRYRANLFEYSMIPVTRTATGELNVDFRIMQRYIDLCAKYGVDECISVFGLVNVWEAKKYGRTAPDYPDGIHVRVYDEVSGCYDYLRTAKEVDVYVKAIERYFIETNQIGKVRVVADEPGDVNAFSASLEHIQSVAPSFAYKTAINHADFVGSFGKDISDFAPYISTLYDQYDALMRYKAEMPGKRFLFYVCCYPDFPNTFIQSESVESYYLGFLTSYTNMDGFLRWNYTAFTDEPRKDIRFSHYIAGDLNFVYPSASGGVLLTLRWKALRKGIKFFTLLNEAKKRGLTDAYSAAIDRVMREKEIGKLYANWDKPKVISLDYADYREAEKILLSALSES